MELTYHTERPGIRGWRYLWAKTVVGFDPTVHCARCLLGEYLPQVRPEMVANAPVSIDLADGTVVYLCGVAMPYRWVNNLHLAVRVRAGATAMVQAYNGDRIEVVGGEPIAFDDTAARRHYPDKGKAFLTCRNYQFGSMLYAERHA